MALFISCLTTQAQWMQIQDDDTVFTSKIVKE